MENPLVVFVSSVISGMEAERRAVRAAIAAIPVARSWLFEESPASSLPLEESYLSQVRACDIFVLLLGDRVTDPVKAEVQTAAAGNKPRLVFLAASAPDEVSQYARSLGVKYANYANPDDLAAKVAEAVGDELISGYRRHGLAQGERGRIGDFLDSLTQGVVQISAGGPTVQVGRDQEVHGDVVLGTKIITGEGATVVIGNDAPVALTAVNRRTALGRYLQHVISRNRYLQLQGIRSGGEIVNIELDRIYVRLRATQQKAVDAEQRWLAEEAALAPGELHRNGERGYPGERPAAVTETVTVAVEEALAGHPRLVVLGDPGSGKTTLLRYLALLYARDLAEEGSSLVHDRLGLAERGRLPVLLALRQIGAFLKEHRPNDDGTEGHALLLEFLRQSLKNERISLPDDFFDPWLEKGEAAILLDGLDEVADPDLRRRVARLVESFTRAYPGCRYVVTSRIVGYTGAARLGEAYVTTTVRDFTLDDVAQFLANWHRPVAIAQMGPGASADAYAAEQTRQLLAAIRANERIRELAINPLMLTVIALVHRDRVKLPDRRAELYAEAVDVLLGKWEEAKGLAEPPILANRPFDAGDRRLILQGVALHMHEGQMKEIATGDLEALLEGVFADLLHDAAAARRAVERFLAVIRERTGLLAARGEGVYAFSHLTFQEYLAATAVVARDDYLAYTLGRVPDAWWREVILLEAGHLALYSRERTTNLIRAIADLKQEPDLYHNLVLAAECLRDVGTGRVQGDLEAAIQQRLRKDLLAPPPVWMRFKASLGAKALVERRSKAAEALARAGAGFWTSPHGEPEWVRIPAGEFWMGSETGTDDEKPLHRVYVEEFAIARVPVTNAQYRLFVERTGYAAPGDWEEGRPRKGRESHPVVNVAWRDAMAYCRWLSDVTGKRITLPTEAQWEKAARGDRDQRAYPWGETFDATKCNSSDLGIGDTTPVGIFPAGASPYGVLDMSGNVWEWTRTLWGKGSNEPSFSYPYVAADGREDGEAPDAVARVLRGGAFYDDARFVRCADRSRNVPSSRNWSLGFRVVASPVIHDSGG